MGNAAFEDLNIDTDIMMSDPIKFALSVYDAAEELRETLRTDTSTATLMRNFEEKSEPADQAIHVLMNAVYAYADDLPIEQLPNIIELSRKLTKDLETLFKDRVVIEASKNKETVKDKKLAAALYKELREGFNSYVEFINMFYKAKLKGAELKLLPSMPGNWGATSTGLKHYTFQIGDDADNIYRQPAAVCRKLNLPLMHMYDVFLDYIEAHPELNISVKEVY